MYSCLYSVHEAYILRRRSFPTLASEGGNGNINGEPSVGGKGTARVGVGTSTTLSNSSRPQSRDCQARTWPKTSQTRAQHIRARADDRVEPRTIPSLDLPREMEETK